jgi:hypothetical protein
LNARSYRWLLSLALALVIVGPGCTTSSTPPPMNQLHIESIAGWFAHYKNSNGNKPPPNEQALIAFIQKNLQERGTTADIEEMFTSPRDGKKYVINYKPNSTNPERNVVVYESEGAGGTKWIGYESKWSEEVDEATLKERLARK